MLENVLSFCVEFYRKKIPVSIALLTNSMAYEPYNDCEKGDENEI